MYYAVLDEFVAIVFAINQIICCLIQYQWHIWKMFIMKFANWQADVSEWIMFDNYLVHEGFYYFENYVNDNRT